jgi:PAS domain S-box-containing protein
LKKDSKRSEVADKTLDSERRTDKKELLPRQLLERALDNMPVVVVIKDTDSRHLFVNKAYCNILVRFSDTFHYTSKDKILGKTDAEIQKSVELANNIRKGDLEVIKKGAGFSRQESSGPGHDGFILTFELIKAPIKDDEDNVTHLVGVLIETTERKRMETIASVKEELRGLPGLSTSLELILDTTLSEFNRDAGVVLLIDREMNLARVQAFKRRVEGLKIDESYTLDGGFVELKVLEKGRSFSKVIETLEPSILGTTSISCVPVYLGRKLYGILALGDVKGRVLEKDHIDILELYGDLASTVFETETLTVNPTKEMVKKREKKFNLGLGKSYLIKNDLEKAYEVFVDQVLGGFEGLCITRDYPNDIRKRYGLEKTPMFWLREEKAKGEKTIHSLQDLSIMLRDFLSKAKHGVVLLNGFEYLVVNHEFKPCIQFLQLARSRFEENKGILISPILENAFEVKELTLLEREMELLATK